MAVSQPTQPMTIRRQMLMNVYWFSMNMMWGSILLIIMPHYIQSVVGDSAKSSILGLVLSAGAVTSMLAAPFFGALSDRIRLPGGRRKPWVILGALAMVPALWVLSYWTRYGDHSSLPGWIVAFLLLELLANIASAPCSALISDLVPQAQRGSAAGWLGLMSMLGIFAGAATGFLIAPLGITAIFNIVAFFIILGALIIAFTLPDSTISPATPTFTIQHFLRGLTSPFKNADFTWVFFNRLTVAMGFFTLQEFILYYMKDAFNTYTLPVFGVVATTPEGAVSIFFAMLFLGSIATSRLAGTLSDRYGRKSIAYTASMVMGIPCMLFTFSHSFPLCLLIALVFGLGYGAYESLAWAMASDVLHSPTDHGRDMGIWHIAIVLPQVIATPVGGFLLDQFKIVGSAYNRDHMGYVIIFVLAVIYFMFSTVFIRQIKGLS